MTWDLNFIKYEDFKTHVKNTINKYISSNDKYDLDRFNRNIIDPVKVVFDKAVYNKTWKEIINSEVLSQRDKSNANQIGYFHQGIFNYIDHCIVPKNGDQGGWDIIVDFDNGYKLENNDTIHRIYIEMKNKHNTMNSAASAKTYIKMQNQLLTDDDCACFLVEAIAKKSQDIIWKTSVDSKIVSHNRIRRVSIDKFYEIITGDYLAFYKIFMVLPDVIDEVLKENPQMSSYFNDTVYEELENISKVYENETKRSFLKSIYLLGYSSYNGFDNLVCKGQ